MKTIRILAFLFYSVLFSNITTAQTTVEGSWLFRDSTSHISLLFKDDGVFTMTTKTVKTNPAKEDVKMGTYKVKDGFIEVRWSINKSGKWIIKSIDENSMVLVIRIPVQDGKPVQKRFLRLRDEEVLTSP